MADVKPPVGLMALLSDCQRVEIPLIQRDYAQGRESQKDVRNEFLDALHTALSRPSDDASLPLNLDFVYGSLEGDDARLLPLDGQQRLTTLFLLHWYAAWLDDRLDDFRSELWDGKHCRFTYRVRPSSAEFFDVFIQYVPSSRPDGIVSVRRSVEDQPWFFLHWRLDPTIQSVLTMLEAIHARFKSSSGIYDKLTGSSPAVTFHVLPLENFGLSDDLYIKMNARGKPLTAFETFKARFEERLKVLFPGRLRRLGDVEVPIHAFFEHRIDTQWTDLFWCNERTAYDTALMNLLVAVIRISLNPEAPDFAEDTVTLGGRFEPSFSSLNDRGWLTERTAEHLIVLLEAWSAGGGALAPQLPAPTHFNELAFFQKAIKAPGALTYFELVQFAALTFYLRTHAENLSQGQLGEWMRVITNLANNSEIERADEFGRVLTAVETLLPAAPQILTHIAAPDLELGGFSPQQVREESLKAALILSKPSWRARIEQAERHGYFDGQIGFLLKFSGVIDRWMKEGSVAWSDGDDIAYQDRFSTYFKKASAVFSDEGLRAFGESRWERALLAKGDYLLKQSFNRSFLENRERDASWKRLLRGSVRTGDGIDEKREYVKQLLDSIDPTQVTQSLDAVISSAQVGEEWRQAVIECPEAIAYCWGRKVRFHSNGNIYLMRRAQMNGEHGELFSYHLTCRLMAEKHARGELAPFGEPRYLSVTDEASAPCAYLSWRHDNHSVALTVANVLGVFRVRVEVSGAALPQELAEGLVSQAGFERLGDAVVRQVKRPEVAACLDDVVGVARGVAGAATI